MADAYARASGNHGVIIAGQMVWRYQFGNWRSSSKAAFTFVINSGSDSNRAQRKGCVPEVDQQNSLNP